MTITKPRNQGTYNLKSTAEYREVSAEEIRMLASMYDIAARVMYAFGFPKEATKDLENHASELTRFLNQGDDMECPY